MEFPTIIFILWAVYILSGYVRLARNYWRARKIGLPILLIPWNNENLIYLILLPSFQKKIFRWLPERFHPYFRSASLGYDYELGWKTYELFGPVYCQVTMNNVFIHAADPEFVVASWNDKKGWKPERLTGKLLSPTGPNLFSSEGHDWQRQRRLIAPLLNESFSKLVWDEGCEQATAMCNYLASRSTNQLARSIDTIAINVLGAAGYGIKTPWIPRNKTKEVDAEKMTFFECMHFQMENYILVTFVPHWILSFPLATKKMKALAIAKQRYRPDAEQMLDQERKLQKDNSIRNNFMSMLIGFLDNEKSSSNTGLREDEVYGNLFVFSLAGFATTAGTLSFALTYMAIHPEWQDWLTQEIDQAGSEPVDYETTFPKLQRCLAFMFEISRLFTPIGLGMRDATTDHYLTTASGKNYYIPKGTTVTVMNHGIHRNPELFGPDPTAFDARRWINKVESSDNEEPLEVCETHIRGKLMTWSGGPRICPGIKMSQVEFAAVIFTILRSWKISPAILPKSANRPLDPKSVEKADGDLEMETLEESRQRLTDCLNDHMLRVTLQLKRPEDIWLKLERRQV